MIPDVIKLTLINLTMMNVNATATLRGDTLKNWETRVLEPEIEKLEAQLPDFNVSWCREVRKFGLFVK